MLEFRDISIDDKERIQKIYHNAPDRGCEYTFGNLYIWHDIYETKIAFSDDGYLVVRFADHVNAFLFPEGGSDLRGVIEEMRADCAQGGVPFRIIAARKEDAEQIEALYPDTVRLHTNRDFFEYVYNSADLIQLAGKKYHGKRNHISRLRSDYPDSEFFEITPENIAEVVAMNESWYTEYLDSTGLEEEHEASARAFRHFFDLGFSGGCLKEGGRVIAFALGEPINRETFCVHMEKACYDVGGAYTVINQQFAEHFCGGYRFINREDDVGQEGLRKAKLSYYPAEIKEKYVVEIQ